MRKFIALTLAAVMALCGIAFAENADTTAEEVEVVEDYTPTELDTEEILDFDIAMDELPAGYQMETFTVDGILYASFANEAEDGVIYYASVAHSEEFDGYTLKLDELTEEDLANMKEWLGEGYNLPEYSFTTTSHGTDVILINEMNCLSDYCEYVTIYDGYIITIALTKNSDLTDDDLATGLKVLSDMWIVPANK